MSYVTIQWPLMLSLILMLPMFAYLFKYARNKRRLVRKALSHSQMGAEKKRDTIRIIATFLIIFALSRPGYAPEKKSISQHGRDVIFAIDVSQSMLARDALPSRLEVSKQAVIDALEQFQAERVALLIYAGSANILCPLTYDYDFVRFMLNQVEPRSVDFGGTTLLAAVQKTVDSVLLDNRSGMQDLIVLTDGENHDSHTDQISNLLKENGLELLLVGIGDKVSGARIPVENSEGKLTYLKYKNNEVYTKLQDEELIRLAKSDQNSSYFDAGTEAFDLGVVYTKYAQTKVDSEANSVESYTVYKEGAHVLIILALLLIVISEGYMSQIILSAILLFSLHPIKGITQEISQREENLTPEEIIELQTNQQFEIASGAWDALKNDGRIQSQEQLAVIELNQGLCFLSMAVNISAEQPKVALEYATMAQDNFLRSKRMSPSLIRAGLRLDAVSKMIAQYQVLVDTQKAREEELQKRIEELIERLQELLESQISLKTELIENDPKRTESEQDHEKKVIVAPALEIVENFENQQRRLSVVGEKILKDMALLDKELSESDGAEQVISILAEPVKLMTSATESQKKSSSLLKDWQRWNIARAKLTDIEADILKILNLLSNSQNQELEENEMEDDDEWDMSDADSENSEKSSMNMEGDLAQNMEMQPLPVPNYSSEDLLTEEKHNMQFRQKQREKAQAGKVEKDW